MMYSAREFLFDGEASSPEISINGICVDLSGLKKERDFIGLELVEKSSEGAAYFSLEGAASLSNGKWSFEDSDKIYFNGYDVTAKVIEIIKSSAPAPAPAPVAAAAQPVLSSRSLEHRGNQSATYDFLPEGIKLTCSGNSSVKIEKQVLKGASIETSGNSTVTIQGNLAENVTCILSGNSRIYIHGDVHPGSKFILRGNASIKFTKQPLQTVIDAIERSGNSEVFMPDGFHPSSSAKETTSVQPSSQFARGVTVNIGGTRIIGGQAVSIVKAGKSGMIFKFGNIEFVNDRKGTITMTKAGIVTKIKGNEINFINNQVMIDAQPFVENDPRIIKPVPEEAHVVPDASNVEKQTEIQVLQAEITKPIPDSVKAENTPGSTKHDNGSEQRTVGHGLFNLPKKFSARRPHLTKFAGESEEKKPADTPQQTLDAMPLDSQLLNEVPVPAIVSSPQASGSETPLADSIRKLINDFEASINNLQNDNILHQDYYNSRITHWSDGMSKMFNDLRAAVSKLETTAANDENRFDTFRKEFIDALRSGQATIATLPERSWSVRVQEFFHNFLEDIYHLFNREYKVQYMQSPVSEDDKRQVLANSGELQTKIQAFLQPSDEEKKAPMSGGNNP